MSAMEDSEVKLEGGNANSTVVKIGNTVRRAMGRSSPSVHRLLRFLEIQGYQGSPRVLGIDNDGREILTYLAGSCSITKQAWTNQSILLSAATLLKKLHDATETYACTSNDKWAYEYPDEQRHEVICHNDFGLYNVVINENMCTGVIDFDLAGPGPRIRDVAYAAYWFVPISQRAIDMKPYATKDVDAGCKRLKQFCSICDVDANGVLLNMISEVLHHMADESAMIRAIGAEKAVQLKHDGHLEHWSGEALAFDQYRGSIETEL